MENTCTHKIGLFPQVCIEDFCGTDERCYPKEYWADWCSECHIVTFGGEWNDIPSMQSETEPTSEQVHVWAEFFIKNAIS